MKQPFLYRSPEVQVAAERTRYDISEGDVIQFCANMTGRIERTLNVPVSFVEGTARGEQPTLALEQEVKINSFLHQYS